VKPPDPAPPQTSLFQDYYLHKRASFRLAIKKMEKERLADEERIQDVLEKQPKVVLQNLLPNKALIIQSQSNELTKTGTVVVTPTSSISQNSQIAHPDSSSESGKTIVKNII